MNVEGLWAAEFGHAGAEFVAANAGVVVFETQRIFGGDSAFAYQGLYTIANGGMSGDLDVYRHTNDPNYIDAFNTGEPRFKLRFEGEFQQDGTMLGRLVHPTQPAIGIRLRKLAELP